MESVEVTHFSCFRNKQCQQATSDATVSSPSPRPIKKYYSGLCTLNYIIWSISESDLAKTTFHVWLTAFLEKNYKLHCIQPSGSDLYWLRCPVRHRAFPAGLSRITLSVWLGCAEPKRFPCLCRLGPMACRISSERQPNIYRLRGVSPAAKAIPRDAHTATVSSTH